MKKRYAALLLALAFIFALAGCGAEAEDGKLQVEKIVIPHGTT